MLINWFTVVAQIINFFVLVLLLKRFLYKPILNAIDNREKLIVAQLEDAETKQAKAEEEQNNFQKKNEEFDKKYRELMNKAVEEANVERQKLLEEAKNESNTLRSKLEETLKDEQQNINREIARKTKEEVFAIARKILSDLASLSLEEQSVNVFIQRLSEIKEEEKNRFIEAFKLSVNPVTVRSAFDLPQQKRLEIERKINELLNVERSFKFQTIPELVNGIEITVDGYKLSWNISDYLIALEKRAMDVY